MTIRYLKNAEVDRRKWDDCITQSINGLIYGYSWYLDEVCDGWDALVLDDYEAVFPLPVKKKYGIFYSFQPLFCQQLGLFVKSPEHQKYLSAFIDKIPKKFKLVRLNFNSLNKEIDGTRQRTNFVLDLIQDYDTLHKNYHRACKKKLRTEKVSNLSVLSGIGTADVLKIYKENLSGKVEFTSIQFQRLENLLNACLSRGCLETAGVYSPWNELCGTASFVKDHRRLYYIAGGANSTGREYSANILMVDHIIAKHAGTNMILDFEGSEIPAVATFFKNFGPAETHYYTFELNRLPWPLNKMVK